MQIAKKKWEELERAIIDQGETQTSLAEKINKRYGKKMRQSDISLYVNGDRKPNVELLTMLCDVLNVSADYLLGLRPEKDPYEELEGLKERLYKHDKLELEHFLDLLFAAEEKSNIHLLDLITFYVFQKRTDQVLIIEGDGKINLKEPPWTNSDQLLEMNADTIIDIHYFETIKHALLNFRNYVQEHNCEREP